jgi:hypothetical protein
MKDPVIITWNVTNWITIFLMAALGYALIAFVSSWYKNQSGGSSASGS